MADRLTPAQVADRWQCSPEHVQRLCARGELGAMKLGRRGWRIPLAAVIAYEARHTTEPESAPELAITRTASGSAPTVEAGGPYHPVVTGPVPWRLEILEAASPAAGRGRSTGTKRKAGSGSN